MKFCLVILNWNQSKETLACLDSLQKLDHPHFETIVIDNGSKEPLPEREGVQLLRLEENRGFAGGCNVGIEVTIQRGADLVVFLNNDARVAPNFLTKIEEAALAHPDAGAFGAKIYHYDDPATIWYAGGEIDPKTGRCFHVGSGYADTRPKYKKLQETGYACGCAMAVRKEVIEKVGGFDERYFLLWEEIDWCTRIKQAGYKVLFVPEARVWHKISSSFLGGNRGSQWTYYYYRNRLLYHKLHTKKRYKGLWKEVAKLDRNCRKAALLGIFDHLCKRYGPGWCPKKKC